jgi:hypothetical protein
MTSTCRTVLHSILVLPSVVHDRPLPGPHRHCHAMPSTAITKEAATITCGTFLLASWCIDADRRSCLSPDSPAGFDQRARKPQGSWGKRAFLLSPVASVGIRPSRPP